MLTGASRGIGRRIALDWASHGAHLVLFARNADALASVSREVKAAGGTATCVAGDVRDPSDRDRLVSTAEADGPVDVLVHNAGIERPVALTDRTDDDIEREIGVNLTAPIHLTRRLLPAMVERGQGAIVMVSSMSGKTPTPYNSIYAATKHGLNGFASSLRIELADTGVHVGVVCPSFVAEAGMWADTGVKAPRWLPEVPLDRVVAGVRRAAEGAPEVLVTPSPVRPLLALAQLWPRIDGMMLRTMGVVDALRSRARGLVEANPSAPAAGSPSGAELPD